MGDVAIDMAGKKFGRWTVVSRNGNKNGQAAWLCKCVCGNESTIKGEMLRRGKSLSCGCLRSEGHKSHGGRYSPEYTIWSGMIQRCTNPKRKGYQNYGGRGIKVTERWRRFENFIADMGQRPSSKHSIDRIDNNGDYCPQNCKWSTQKEQIANQRKRTS